MQPRRSNKEKNSAEVFFGQALRERRADQGLTQEELAFKSGYHPTYIGQLERGAKNPTLRTIMSLAAVLDTPGSELVRRVESLMSKSL
jgi:transcriptional regulator with XRE-family HTH domain